MMVVPVAPFAVIREGDRVVVVPGRPGARALVPRDRVPPPGGLTEADCPGDAVILGVAKKAVDNRRPENGALSVEVLEPRN